MFQVFQEIESKGYVCRELYVDTHSVNLSRAAEEVAAMFRVKIIPSSCWGLSDLYAAYLHNFLDLFFVHVFGCPCQYAPDDNKVISVSRHKVHCHEEAYAKYDPATGGKPLENFAVPRTAPPEKMEIFFDPQHSNQGEKIFVPDLDYSDIDAVSFHPPESSAATTTNFDENGMTQMEWICGNRTRISLVR